MPRKTKVQKKKLQLAIDGTLYAVTLRPPTGTRRTWYAYWAGAVYQRSTDQPDEQAAVRAAEDMLRRWLKGDNGLKSVPLDAVLTDAEFEEVQRRHYGRRTDAAARARAARSLVECLDAATAFQAISGLDRVVLATPDHCARFQHEALQKLRNWRKQHPKSKATTDTISPNTVLKWSRCLQAAFERVNRNAGKRCVRGVVPEDKLIAGNPWGQFTWIEGTRTPLRQFDAAELVSLLDFVEGGSPDVPVAALAVKVLLWSCCRKLELAGLTWDMLRLIGPADAPAEVHFDFVGKHGVPRWFRIPDGLYRELLAQRVPGRPEVFAAYTPQIRRRHAGNPTFLGNIRADFTAGNFGDWVYHRVKEWAASRPGADAHVHVFRKTGLQFVYDGEETGRVVAADAGVGERVLLGHYVKPKLWRASNLTYRRLLAALPAEVARRYGYAEDERTRLERELEAARETGDWKRVSELAARLGGNTVPAELQAG